MSSFQLKMIAIISMLIDHIGAVVFPQFIEFRIIGRLAFPLFAFLITEGYRHTSNFKRYLLRLFIFAIISQYPFWLAFGFDAGLNIFFTLTLGLIVIYISEEYNNFLLVLLLAVLADLLNTDFGMLGVLVIFIIHLYRDDFFRMVSFVSGLYIVMFLLSGLTAAEDSIHYYIQLFALVSFVFMRFYSGREGLKLKYFFYLFYPVHLLLLGVFF